MDINEIRAKRLREVIEKSEYTYAELEKLTGVSKSSLQRYATGETIKVPIDCFEKIAAITGADILYLLAWDDSPIEDKQAHLAKIVKDSHPEGVPAAVSVTMGLDTNKAPPRIKREDAFKKLSSLSDDEFREVELFADFIEFRRNHQK